MYGIALTRAIPQRTASAVLFFGVLSLSLLGCGRLQAQEVIYRCGQEYTNAPKDLSRCERLPEQSVTLISGLRPQGVMPKATVPQPSARTVLAQELARLEKQHQAWAQEIEMLLSQTGTAEYGAAPKNQDRVAALQVAMERAEREIEALQRQRDHGPKPVTPLATPMATPIATPVAKP
jgi:hypothetical protein